MPITASALNVTAFSTSLSMAILRASFEFIVNVETFVMTEGGGNRECAVGGWE